MSALFAILLTQAAPAAAPAPAPTEVPTVEMSIARARVAKVRTLLSSVTSGDAAALAPVLAPGASANVNGVISPLGVLTLAPLQSCTRKGPFNANADQVIITMTCTGSLPAAASVMVGFTAEQISSVVVGPAAPPVGGS